MKISKILAFLGLAPEISEKLSADQISKLEAAEESLNMLEISISTKDTEIVTLQELVQNQATEIASHLASIASHEATIEALNETIANGPAASTTQVVSDGDQFNDDQRAPRVLNSWEVKAAQKRNQSRSK